MKKSLLALFSINLLILPLMATANGLDDPELTPAPTVKILGEGGVLDKIADYLFTILLAVAVIFFVVAGFYFINSQGDPQKYETAKKMVLYAVIGLGVAFCAKGIVLLLQKIFIGDQIWI